VSSRGPSPPPGVIRLEGEGTFLTLSSIDADALSEIIRRHRATADPACILKRNRGTIVTRVRIAEGELGRSLALDVVVKDVEIPWRWRLIRLAGRRSPFAEHFETEA
jgi:hypothetical protein